MKNKFVSSCIIGTSLLFGGYYLYIRPPLAVELALGCKEGEEMGKWGKCYPKCKDGFEGDSSTCRQTCPSNFIESALYLNNSKLIIDFI